MRDSYIEPELFCEISDKIKKMLVDYFADNKVQQKFLSVDLRKEYLEKLADSIEEKQEELATINVENKASFKKTTRSLDIFYHGLRGLVKISFGEEIAKALGYEV